jgi:hypothetical protein
MKLHYHTAFSLTISGILYLFFKSWGLALGCLISGIFIDLDHIYDYLREHGRNISVRNFFRINNHAQYNRIVLFWHGWEWIVLWGISAWISGWNPWISGVFIGLSQHMFLDVVSNRASLQSYSLIWRWKQKFEFDTIFYNLKGRKYSYKKISSKK